MFAPAHPSTAGSSPRSPTAWSYCCGVMLPGVICSQPLNTCLGLLAMALVASNTAPRSPCNFATARAACRRWGRPGCSSPWPWCRRGRRCAGRCRDSPPVPPACARTRDHREVGGLAPNHSLTPAWDHRRLHGFADLVGGEQQVVLDLLLGQADVLQAVEAHERSGVAVQAVVDEQLGAVLQRSLVP